MGQLPVKVYTDAHHHSVHMPFTWKQKFLEFLVIPPFEEHFLLWHILYFRQVYFYLVFTLSSFVPGSLLWGWLGGFR